MPVSSLDFLLVDAKAEFALDIESVDDDLQNVEYESKPSLLRQNSQDSKQNMNNIDSLDISTSGFQDEPSRANTWANLLGVNPIKGTESLEYQLDESRKTNSHENIEKTGIFSEFGTNANPVHDIFSMNDLPPHKDEAQVMLDVKRLFTVISHYNSFNLVTHSSYTTIFSEEDIEAMRKRLFCLIIRILRKYPSLNYYQGFHDIAGVVLLVCNESSESSDEEAFRILEVLTLNHLRDFMIQDISLTINHLKLIPLIVEAADPEMFDLMKNINNTYCATGGTFYDYKFLPALLSILTLFSHDLVNTHHLMHIWDYILGHGSVVASAYLYAAFLMNSKAIIFKELGLTEDVTYEVIDLDLAHSLLSPKSILSDISELELLKTLEDTTNLIEMHPIDKQANSSNTFDVWFKRFNCNSVVMTSSKLSQIQLEKKYIPTPDELETLLNLQEAEQQRESANDADILQQAFDQIDSLSTSINSSFDDESTKLSISSSLMSLKAVSSSLNHTLINSSSNLLRKLTSHEEGTGGGHNPNRDFTLSIYKLSLTIGFVGVLLHFLLKQSEFGNILRLSPKGALHTVAKQVSTFGETNLIKIMNGVSSAVNTAKEYGPIRDLTDITQVGLKSLKRSIYTMGFLPQ